MKEKIGIEKLIELLNEYLNDKVGYIQYHNEYGFKRTKTKYEVEGERFLQDEYVLGKKFGFIKWLVENDKIDLDTQAMQYAKSDLSKFFTEWEDENGMSDDYAMLLMLLAIQDEPINFLVSILK